MVKVNPLAYWEFRDCWDYIKKYNLAYHPLHDQGYPSVGDIHSTLPVRLPPCHSSFCEVQL
jgi:phosphoadenosine phosphosulfate reductase